MGIVWQEWNTSLFLYHSLLFQDNQKESAEHVLKILESMNNYLITRDKMTGIWLPHHKCIGHIFHLSNQNSNFSRKKFWFRDNLIDECWKTNNVALERFCKWMKFYGPFQTFAYTAVGTIFSQSNCFNLFIRFRCKSVAKKKSF